VHVPKTQARLADLLPRLDSLPELDGRLDVRVAEVADADDSAANEFVERVSYPAQRRLMHRASLDGEDGVAARGVVLEDVDRLVVTGPQPRHLRRPFRGRVAERPVDGVGAVLRRHGPAREVVVVFGREAQRAADGLARGGDVRPNRERWHASRV
jgi:hypothetical protein